MYPTSAPDEGWMVDEQEINIFPLGFQLTMVVSSVSVFIPYQLIIH
jgi:hypothetical protein